MANNRIIDTGLLTKPDVDRLGATFSRLWPVDDAPCFEKLLAAIDDADWHLHEDIPPRLVEAKA